MNLQDIDRLSELIREERQLLANRIMVSNYGGTLDCVPRELHEQMTSLAYEDDHYSNVGRGLELAGELIWDHGYSIALKPLNPFIYYQDEYWQALCWDPSGEYRTGVGFDRSLAVAIGFAALGAFENEADALERITQEGWYVSHADDGQVLVSERLHDGKCIPDSVHAKALERGWVKA